MPLTTPIPPEVREADLLLKKMRFLGRQAAGKFRRFVFANIRRSKVDEMLSRRQGECTRCGACCKILIRCPFLIEEPGQTYKCGIYGAHFNSCRIFPLMPQDLEEIEEECGYTFPEPVTAETHRPE